MIKYIVYTAFALLLAGCAPWSGISAWNGNNPNQNMNCRGYKDTGSQDYFIRCQ